MWISAETLTDLTEIVWLDVVLSGDSALVIGMAAAGLALSIILPALFYGDQTASRGMCGAVAWVHRFARPPNILKYNRNQF